MKIVFRIININVKFQWRHIWVDSLLNIHFRINKFNSIRKCNYA